MKISLPLVLTLTLVATAGQLMAEHNLIEIINSLNENLYIEWNLIITKPDITPDIEDVLKQANKSILIVTKREMEILHGRKFIHELHSKNMLTIVHVADNERGNTNESLAGEVEKLSQREMVLQDFVQMANLTKFILRNLHFTDILWITKAGTLESLYDFANICWDFGFTKVLFYHNSSVFVYDKFPSLTVKTLSSLDSYFARKELDNFHDYPITIPITSSPPRCYRYKRGHTYYTGYMFYIITLFIYTFNFGFSAYPHNYNDDDKEPLMRALAAGTMDFTPFLTYPNSTYDASDVLWNTNVYVLVPNAKPIPKYQYFQKPFANLIWFLNMLVILMASVNIAGFLYVNHQGWDFSKSLIYVFSMSIYQHHLELSVRSWRFNLHNTMLIVYSFIVVNYYLCSLSSLLVSTLYEPQINSLEDLKSTNFRLMLTQADMDYYAQLPGGSPIVNRIAKVEDGLILDELRRNLSTSVLHAAFEDKLKFFLYQQRFLKVPRLRYIDEVLYSVPLFFTIRPNLPYIELFNRYLRNLWASGILWHTYENMEYYGIQSGHIRYLMDEEDDNGLLTLEYFYSPLLLYCVGVILSILAFCVEILYFKWNTENS